MVYKVPDVNPIYNHVPSTMLMSYDGVFDAYCMVWATYSWRNTDRTYICRGLDVYTHGVLTAAFLQMFYCSWGSETFCLSDAVCVALGPVANEMIWYICPKSIYVVLHGCVQSCVVLNHFEKRIFCHIVYMHSDTVHESFGGPGGHLVSWICVHTCYT